MAGPGSHQLTNTRMPNHDTSVVIQQAMPSPQSSSVITQAPSTNRQIGWVHFRFLVSPVLWLQQLHGGPSVAFVVLKVQLHAGPDVVFMVLEVTGFALGPASMRQGPLQHVVAHCGGMARLLHLLQTWHFGWKGQCAVLAGKSCFLHSFFCFYLLTLHEEDPFYLLTCCFFNCPGKKEYFWSWSFCFLQWEFWVLSGIGLFPTYSV